MEPKYIRTETEAFRRYAATDPIIRDLIESRRAECDKQTRRGRAPQTRHDPDSVAEQFRAYGAANKERFARELQELRRWRPTRHLNEEALTPQKREQVERELNSILRRDGVKVYA